MQVARTQALACVMESPAAHGVKASDKHHLPGEIEQDVGVTPDVDL